MISVFKEAVKDAIYPKKNGILTKRNKFMSVNEPQIMSGAEIKRLRNSLHLSSSVFAQMLAVSTKTVEAWESGVNEPSGPALRLMNMIRKYPDLLLETNVFTEKIR